MTTPPVPQWAVDAAKAHFADMFKLFECDPDAPEQMGTVMELARIIAAHAPRSHEEDSARLDWLEGRTVFVQRFHNPSGPSFVHIVDHTETHKHTTLRAAIDAAMKKDL